MAEAVAVIHQRFTYRMHDLAEFMKGLLQRFTQWFNRVHSRSGTLWEDRFKSVISLFHGGCRDWQQGVCE